MVAEKGPGQSNFFVDASKPPPNTIDSSRLSIKPIIMLLGLRLVFLLLVFAMSTVSIASPEARIRSILLHRQQRLQQQDVEPERPILLIEGARFPAFDFARRKGAASAAGGVSFEIDGRPVYLVDNGEDGAKWELKDEEHTVRTAGSIWDCGIILSKYLEKQATTLLLRGRRIIELGAGKSLPGLSAAILGARVTLTDAPGVVPLIRRIVALNGLDAQLRGPEVGAVERVEALDWIERDQYLLTILPPTEELFDLILCADVVWVEYLIEPLVATLSALARTSATQILLAHQTRSTRVDARLFAELNRIGFEHEAVPPGDLAREDGFWKETVSIFRVWRPRDMKKE
ncbi:putative methyltransferase-domain-containing protein [Jimgerdemannia flammicorona]|uniref:Putative methyltransferase-domain-containing protein n=1 Tax=Jimgerdemannia flammicorona TaxID=994334 RepID=A0A433D7Y9_9FUNG|nr:putative methyltransferase-domain-containing protein [Jimgerdemannia flammicorona]